MNRVRFYRIVIFTSLLALLASGISAPGGAWGSSQAELAAGAAAGKVRLVSAEADRLVLEFDLPQISAGQVSLSTPHTGQGNACQQLNVNGLANSAAPGAAQLPVTGALLGIPSAAQVELAILETEYVDLPGVYDLCPAEQPPDVALPGRPAQLAQVARRAPAAAREGFAAQPAAELAMTGFVRSQRVAQVLFRPFQYDAASGRLRQALHIRVALTFRNAAPAQSNWITAFSTEMVFSTIDEGPFEAVLRSSLLNYDQARAWRTRPAAANIQRAEEAADAPLRIKILVDQDGIYQIGYGDLAALGVDVDAILPRTLRMFNRGAEIAIEVTDEADFSFDPGDFIRFYGQAVDTKYTATNVYYLQVGPGYGKRMAQRSAAPNGAAAPTYFLASQRIEKNLLYLSDTPSGPQQDLWYWYYVYGSGGPASETVTFTLGALDATAPISATLRGLFKGYAGIPQHHTRVYLNGHLLHDAYWADRAEYAFSVNFPPIYLVEGVNAITVECPMDGGISMDIPLINSYELDYPAAFTALDDRLVFTGDVLGQSELQVGGFSTPALEVFDITEPDGVSRMVGFDVRAETLASEESAASAYTLVLGRNFQTPPRRYFALAAAQRRSPQQIMLDAPADLRSSANGADYIIITHPDFAASLQALADHRAGRGLRVKLVDIFDVYDEFNDGLVDPQAIRDFLAYAYANWTPPAPLYVLVVGDGTFDPRNYLYSDPNYIPPYLVPGVDPYMGETVADNRLAMIVGADNLPDIALGRIPARSSAEVDVVINKIIGYENAPHDLGWTREVLFIADNRDYAGNFDLLSDAVVALLPPEYAARKVYMGVNYTDRYLARKAVRDEINNGVLLVNYIGHGAINFWGGEYYLDSAGVSQLTNAGKLAFFLPMTCLEGSYQHPIYEYGESKALADLYLFHAQGGAVGSWSPTGLGIATGHDFLNRGLYKAFFEAHIGEVGLAAIQGDLFLVANSGGSYLDLLDTYLIFGDPALRLHITHMTYLPLLTLLP